MTDVADQVEEEVVEVEEVPYDAMSDLTKRKNGIQCPNDKCNDRLFSYDFSKSISCRCGLTFLSGGDVCLKAGTSYPFTTADIRVVFQVVETFQAADVEETVLATEGFAEAVAEELGQVVEETPEDLAVGDGGDSVLDAPEA